MEAARRRSPGPHANSVQAGLTLYAPSPCPFRPSETLSCTAALPHRLQLGDHTLDHRKADFPEAGVLRVETEGRKKFGIGFRPAGREHREIALGEAFRRALIEAIERIYQTIAERIGVDVERRMDEMADIGPVGLVAGL